MTNVSITMDCINYEGRPIGISIVDVLEPINEVKVVRSIEKEKIQPGFSVVKIKTTNKGRKAKVKKAPRKTHNGSCRSLSSQISLWFKTDDKPEPYKLKLFMTKDGKNTHCIQVPGVVNLDMSDCNRVMALFRQYLSSYGIVVGDEIGREFIIVNFQTDIPYDQSRFWMNTRNIYDRFYDLIGINSLLDVKYNEDCISTGLYFSTPKACKPGQRTTVVIRRSGVIEYKGHNDPEKTQEIHEYIMSILQGLYDEERLFSYKVQPEDLPLLQDALARNEIDYEEYCEYAEYLDDGASSVGNDPSADGFDASDVDEDSFCENIGEYENYE